MKEPNQEKEFERLLKEKSEGFELKPSDEVWQSVSSSLKRDRRRIIFWWTTAAMLAVAIGTGAYFIVQNENSASNKSEVIVSKSSETKNLPESNQNLDKEEPGNSSIEYSEKKDGSSDDLKKKEVDSKRAVGTTHSVSKKNDRLVAQEIPSVNYEEREADEISRLSSSMLPIDDGSNNEVSIRQKDISATSSILLMENVMSPHFAIEADGMWAVTYSRNVQSGDVGSSIIQTPPSNNSFWNTKGFSAGGNFLFYPEKKWFIGSGIHFTKTNTQVILADQTIPQYDTTYLTVNNTLEAFIDTSLVAFQPTNRYSQEWLDVSFMAGMNFFPASKNHLRLMAGAAYSRLLSVKSQTESPNGSEYLDISFSGSGGATGVNTVPQPFTFERNQVQLFTEVAYVRDLGSHFSVSAGGQLHYYPMNLWQDNSVEQHMFWAGLKCGVQYTF